MGLIFLLAVEDLEIHWKSLGQKFQIVIRKYKFDDILEKNIAVYEHFWFNVYFNGLSHINQISKQYFSSCKITLDFYSKVIKIK